MSGSHLQSLWRMGRPGPEPGGWRGRRGESGEEGRRGEGGEEGRRGEVESTHF